MRKSTTPIRRTIKTLLLSFAAMLCAWQAGAQAITVNSSGGTATANYASLLAAVTAINGGTHTGTISVTVNTSVVETSQSALASSGTGAASYTSIVIKPAALTTPTISATYTTASTAILKLNGADNVTIDGSNTVGGITRDLTFARTNATTTTMAIWIAAASAADGATSNTVKNCNFIGSGPTGTGFGIFSGGTTNTTTAALAANSNNTIQNNSITTFLNGIATFGFATAPNYDQNWVIKENVITNLGLRGIWVQNASNFIVNNNTISNFAATNTSATVPTSGMHIGLAIAGGNIFNNTIRSINNTSQNFGAAGMYLSASTTASAINVYNNIINDIWVPKGWTTTGAPDNGYGITIDLGGGYNLYHNTVVLSTTPSVTGGLTTAALNITAGVTTVGAINLRDNILVNNQTANNTNRVAVLFSAASNNRFASIDFNDYIGNTALGRFGATSCADILAMQTNFGGNAASISVAPTFVSSTNARLLHVTANQSLKAGTPIVSPVINTDIDLNPRSATTPFIGAHEVSLVITYTPLAGQQCGTGDVPLTATIVEATGINNAAQKPQVFFRKNGGTWQNAAGVLATGTVTNGTWDFVISAVALGGVAGGDVIQYFVVAQNTGGTVFSSPNSGIVATNTTTIATFPGTPNSYTISAQLNTGSYHVGVGKTYATITQAVNAYNTSCLNGPVTFLLDDNSYPSEPAYPIVITNNAFASSVNTLTIKPNTGATPSVSNTTATAIFKLNGADYVTIDGSNTVGGTSQNLTISNTNTALSTIIWIGSANATDAATNNTIKNCNMFGASSTTTAGVLIGSGTTLGNAGEIANNNNTVQNNTISSVQNAVYASGSASNDNNWVVTGNTFNSLGFRGMIFINASNFTISNNLISNVTVASTSTATGIMLSGNIITGNIFNNKINTISNTGGGLATGMLLNASVTSSSINIYNNFIADVIAGGSATLTLNGYGLYFSLGTGYNVYYNTISQNVNQPAAGVNACVIVNGATTAGAINLRNNILSNTETTGTRYAIYSATANTVFASIDYNDYYVTAGGNLGFLTSARLDLPALQTGFGSNVNSKNVLPAFVSSSDLHLQQSLANQLLVSGTPIAVPSITTDIDGTTRSVVTTVMGAHEVSIGVTYTALTNTCSTGDRVLTATLLEPGTVNTGTNPPLIYFRKNGGAWFTSAGVLQTGTTTNGTWNFTISAATMGGLVGLETIEYFVIMQNVTGPVVVKSSPSLGLVATSTTAISTYPAFNSYTIGGNLTGSYHVGTGKTFTTITKAVNAYNTACSITGAVTFLLDDAVYAGETLPIQVNASAFSSVANTLTIKPNPGVSSTVSGNSTAIFQFNGADFVTIDGSNTVGGTTRNLTISNTNAGAAAVIWINSTAGADAATNIAIKNSNINGAGSVTTLYGIVLGGSVSFTTAAQAANNNNTIQNNAINNVQSAIYHTGFASSPFDANLTISNNTLSTLGARGLLVRNAANFTISGNTINDVVGAFFDNSFVFMLAGMHIMGNSSGGNIFNNKINNINNTLIDWGANGIFLNSTSTTANINVYNNFVSNVFSSSGFTADVTPFDNGYGISISSGAGYNLYHNTVVLTTSQAAGMSTAPLNVTSGVTTVGAVNLVDNILVNNQTSGAASRVAIYSTATITRYGTINYNDYVGGTGLGFIGSNRTTLAAMITGFGGNANSINVSPTFVSTATGDLHLTTAAINGSFQMGTPIAVPSITTDIDGATRATIPVIGAHEIHIGPTITYTAITAITCGAGDITLSNVNISDALGVPLVGITMPRIYYKKNASGWNSAQGIKTAGTATNGTWSFTMLASDMAGLTDGDIISYYVIAQNTPPGNVSSNPATGLVATDVNNVSTPPTTPNTTVISLPSLTNLTASRSFCFNAGAAQPTTYTYTAKVGTPSQYTLIWTPTGVMTDVPSFTALAGTPGGTFNVTVPANAPVNTYTGVFTVQNTVTTCTNTQSVTLTVNALPTPSFLVQAGTNTCANTDVTYTTEPGMTNYVWTFPGSTLTTDYTITSGGTSGSNSVVVKWVTPGSKTVAVNYTNANTCTAVSATTSNATIVKVPPVGITGNSQMCAGGSTITLANASAGGTWASNNVPSSNINSATGEITPGIQGTALITYDNGCGTATTTATVNATPTAGGMSGNTQMCASGSTILLTNSATNGTWSGGTAGIATVTVGSITGTVTPGATQGITTINYSNNCGSASLTATVNATPTAGGMSGNTQMCVSGSTILLTNSAANGTWSGGTAGIATVTVGSITGTVTPGATQGTTTINYSNNCGSASLTATVNATPTAGSMSGNTQMCASGSTILLTNSATNGTWSGGTAGIATVTVGSLTGTVTPGATQGTTTINYSNNCGSASLTATVNATPTAGGMSGNTQMCASGSTILLTNSATNGTWSGGTAGIATVTVGSLTGTVTPGATQGTTTINYSNNCGSASLTATVNATPTAGGMGGNAQMCTNAPAITLTNTATNGTWSGGTAGVATVTVGSLVGTLTPGATQGTTTINYSNNCGSASLTATVNAVPAPIGGNSQMCVGGSTMTLTNTSTNGVWSGGTAGVATINSASGLVTSGATSGTATFSYANGCGSATSFTTTVNAAPGAIGGNVPMCSGGNTLTLTNPSPYGTWSSSNPSVGAVNMFTGVVTSGNSGTAVITYDNSCGTAATATITVNQTPTIQTFTGGGGYCIGGTGVSIGLTLTEPGVNYELFMGGTSMSSVMAGTGFAITFGTTYATPGYYYAIATNATSFCNDSLAGVTVHIDPLPDTFTITGGGSYCSSNPTGVLVGLTGSAVGVSYQLYDVPGGSPIGSPVAGTGSAISFGLQLAGTYMAVATNTSTGCVNDMAGEVTVDLFASPTTYNVTGGGTYCLGGSGVLVGVDNSDVGTNYQLIYLGFIPIGGAVAGTGSSFDFGTQFLPGVYTVVATNTNGCTDTMAGSATLTFSLPPAFFFVGGGGGYCVGDSGVHITLSGSALGVRYQIYRADTAIGAPVDGTSAALDFGWFTTVGTYTVLATDTTSGCTSNMFGSATVSVNPVVTAMVSLNTGLGHGNRVCFGNTVTFTAQTSNGGTAPAYEWKINNITVTPPDSTFTYVPTDGDIVWVKMTSNSLCAIPAVAMDTMIVDVDTFATPSVFIDVNPQTSVRLGDTVILTATVTNGGPAPLYQWYKNGIIIPGATNATYSNSNFNKGDSMTVRVITSGGCGGTITFNSVVIYVFGVGVANVQPVISDVRLIPNPNKGSFAVTGTLSVREDAEVHIEVMNMLGQTVYEGTVMAKKGVINSQIQLTTNLANGMYMLNLQSGTDKKVFHFVLEQ